MNQLNESAGILQMIREGELITAEQIKSDFGLSENQIRDAIRHGGLDVVHRIRSREYFLTQQVELLKEVMDEEDEPSSKES